MTARTKTKEEFVDEIWDRVTTDRRMSLGSLLREAAKQHGRSFSQGLIDQFELYEFKEEIVRKRNSSVEIH